MNVNLFTFIAQIINFIILIVLLYFFLFKKIIRAIDHREKTLQNEFEEAEKNKTIAVEEKRDYENRLKELDRTKEDLLTQVHEEVKGKKEHLLQEAHAEIDEKKRVWEKRIETDKKEFLSELQRKIGVEVYATSRGVLKDLANVDLQRQITTRFLEVLKNLSEQQIKEFQKSYQEKTTEEIEIISLFELTQEEKNELEKVFEKILQEKPKISFKTDSEQSLGISASLNSFRFSWTTKNYLDLLTDKFEKILE